MSGRRADRRWRIRGLLTNPENGDLSCPLLLANEGEGGAVVDLAESGAHGLDRPGQLVGELGEGEAVLFGELERAAQQGGGFAGVGGDWFRAQEPGCLELLDALIGAAAGDPRW
jgi:hypothetical protein